MINNNRSTFKPNVLVYMFFICTFIRYDYFCSRSENVYYQLGEQPCIPTLEIKQQNIWMLLTFYQEANQKIMEQVIVHTHLHKYDFMSISRSIYYYMQLISTILGETVHLLLYSLNSCLLEITISMSIIFIETGFFIKKIFSIVLLHFFSSFIAAPCTRRELITGRTCTMPSRQD